jgi:hypothetical protein
MKTFFDLKTTLVKPCNTRIIVVEVIMIIVVLWLLWLYDCYGCSSDGNYVYVAYTFFA